MNTQPEALRLADNLGKQWTLLSDQVKAAAELRRLHAVNQDLLKALGDAATSLETISRLTGKAAYLGDDGERIPTYMEHHDQVRGYATSRAVVARTAIAKATGEKA